MQRDGVAIGKCGVRVKRLLLAGARNKILPILGWPLVTRLTKPSSAATETLLAAVGAEFPGLSLTLEHSEHFRPGKPQPTHRDVTAR